MTVQEFVDEYNEINKKTFRNDNEHAEEIINYVSNHIVNNYINIEKKDAICRLIVEKTMNDKIINNIDIFKQNSVVRHVHYNVMLIKEYTDIIINDNDILYAYNELNKNGLINIIFEMIPINELNEFNKILDLTIDDYYENNRNVINLVESKIKSIEIILNSFLDLISNDETIDNINKILGDINEEKNQ